MWTTDTEQVQAKRNELRSLLGDLPDINAETPVRASLIDTEDREAYILEKLMLHLNGLEEVPAYFVRPKGASGAWPVILFNHSHGGNYELGKDELVSGNRYMSRPPYAEALAAKGIASLAIDAWNFGERRGRTELESFKEMLWNGRVLWGMMVFDSLRAIDYLVSRPDVDSTRIGTLGMSMGSTMAWWVAALDTRIKVCVDICCLTDFAALVETRGLDGHGIYYYVPGLVKHFTAGEINALIAPRPHLGLAGNLDRLTPPHGLDRIDRYLRDVYATHDAHEAWQLIRYNVGHVETAAMRAAALNFVDQWL